MYELLLIATIGINIAADFLDRYASNKSDPYVLTLWTSIVQFLLIFPIIGLVQRLSVLQFILIAFVSAIASYGRTRWFRALAEGTEQLSRLAPLTRLSSVVVLVMAVVLLGESLSLTQAAGAALIIGASFLVSLERWSSTLSEFVKNNRALGLIVMFAVSIGCLTVLYKYLLLEGVNIWTIYFYVRLFQLIPLLLYGAHRNVIVSSYLKISNLRLFVLGRLLQTVAAFLYLFVIKHLELTTVEPIAALSPLLLLFIEWVMSKHESLLRRRSFAEPLQKPSRKLTPLRLVAVVITIAGLFLLRKS